MLKPMTVDSDLTHSTLDQILAWLDFAQERISCPSNLRELLRSFSHRLVIAPGTGNYESRYYRNSYQLFLPAKCLLTKRVGRVRRMAQLVVTFSSTPPVFFSFL